MTDPSIFEALERERLAALVAADIDAARPFHADDYQLITGNGGLANKEQYLQGIAAGTFRYIVFEPASDLKVTISGDIAIVRYLAQIEIRFPEGIDHGRFWHTDIYELREGSWQVIMSQATPDASTRAHGLQLKG